MAVIRMMILAMVLAFISAMFAPVLPIESAQNARVPLPHMVTPAATEDMHTFTARVSVATKEVQTPHEGVQVATVLTRDDVIAYVYHHAWVYGVDANTLLYIGQCESKLEPYAVGDYGRSVGPFQFHEGGIWPWTPAGRRGYSRWHIEQNVAMAAWAYKEGLLPTHWVGCWRRYVMGLTPNP